MNYLSHEVCVTITNYDFSQNASLLKKQFSNFFHTVLIDASSPLPPTDTDISIPNSYYPGLWNRAFEYSKEKGFKWLLFIASDVEITDAQKLALCIQQVINREDVGAYSPSLRPGSRTSFANSINKNTTELREVGIIEGFFFLAPLEVLATLYPIDQLNKFGWGIDVKTCKNSYDLNKIVILDDRIEIFHPCSKVEHRINVADATKEALNYMGVETYKWAVDIHERFKNNPIYIENCSTLDIGCGTRVANPFNANNLYGVDIRESIDKKIRAADLNVDKIPFPDNFFDFVTAYDFIQHVPRLIYCPQRRFPFVELMNEIFRVLKPGGFFLSNTPAYPDVKAFQDPTHVNIITENTFEYYFCHNKLWARIYGFNGKFLQASQNWDDGKLQTILRVIK
jgi:SAM-dependent methyltransferase